VNFQPINKFFVPTLLLTVVLLSVMSAAFDRRESRLRSTQQEFLSAQQVAWAQEDAQRAMTAREKVVARAGVRAEELLKAFGGPVQAAVKNPDLSIQEMLAETASACAPTGTRVSVSVDSFTEFNLAITLRERLTSIQEAKICQCLLTNAAPYVHSIRFILGNDVLVELNRQAIESVTDWRSAPVGKIEGLLSTTEVQDLPSLANNAASDETSAEQDLSPEQKKFSEAEKYFEEDQIKHLRTLNGLAAGLYETSRLDTLRSRGELQSRIASLNELTTQLSSERDFFASRPTDMERLLNDQGLNPLVIAITKRDVIEQDQAESAGIAEVFDAISAYRDQMRLFLTSMASYWGQWTAEPATQKIQFTTPAAHDAYVLGTALLTQRAQSMQRAFELLNNSKPPK
jgi:hypothetical protein